MRNSKLFPNSDLQNTAVDRLETVANVRQGTAEQHGHSIGHVGIGGLLVELNTNDSLVRVLDQDAPIPILPLAGAFEEAAVFAGRRFDGAGAEPGPSTSTRGGGSREEPEVEEGVAEGGEAGRVERCGEAATEESGREAETGG